MSDKVLTMVLSGILIGGSTGRPKWLVVGVTLIAVDTLVHNFLHRTGILSRFNAAHPYGPGCYRAAHDRQHCPYPITGASGSSVQQTMLILIPVMVSPGTFTGRHPSAASSHSATTITGSSSVPAAIGDRLAQIAARAEEKGDSQSVWRTGL